jgi:hypothetical protein
VNRSQRRALNANWDRNSAPDAVRTTKSAP